MIFRMAAVLSLLFFLCPLTVYSNKAPEEVIVQADSWDVSASDLELLFKIMNDKKRDVLRSDPIKLKKFVKRLAETRALAEYAQKEGFLQRPEVRAEVQRMRNEVIAQLYIREALKGLDAEITDRDARLYYKANRDEFRTSDKVKLRVVKFPVGKFASDEVVKEIFHKIQKVKEELSQGKRFDALAQEYNVLPELKAKKGNLGRVSLKDFSPELVRIIDKTKNGKYFGPVRTNSGIYYGRVLGRKKGELLPFKVVKEDIKSRLLKEK